MRDFLLAAVLCLAAVPLCAQNRGNVLVQSFASDWTAPWVFNLYGVSADGTSLSHLSRVTTTDDRAWTYRGLLVPRPRHMLFVQAGIAISNDGVNVAARLPVYSSGEIVPLQSGRFLAAMLLFHTFPHPKRLITFDASGTVLSTQDLPQEINFESAHLELLSDQCTLLYSVDPFMYRRTIFRYDVCRRLPLPDFATMVPYAGAIRQLPDGDVLIAAGHDVRRCSSRGELIRIYQVPATHIALTPDAQGFWAIDDPWWSGPVTTLHRVDFATPDVPAVSLPIDYEKSQPGGTRDGIAALAVVGEWRASATKPKTRAARH